MEAQRLTEKERVLKKYISNYILKNEERPTQRQMMKAIGLKSVSGVSQRLDDLESKGHIKRINRGGTRNIIILNVNEPCLHCGK